MTANMPSTETCSTAETPYEKHSTEDMDSMANGTTATVR